MIYSRFFLNSIFNFTFFNYDKQYGNAGFLYKNVKILCQNITYSKRVNIATLKVTPRRLANQFIEFFFQACKPNLKLIKFRFVSIHLFIIKYGVNSFLTIPDGFWKVFKPMFKYFGQLYASFRP